MIMNGVIASAYVLIGTFNGLVTFVGKYSILPFIAPADEQFRAQACPSTCHSSLLFSEYIFFGLLPGHQVIHIARGLSILWYFVS